MKARMLLRNGRTETKEGDPTEVKYWIERKFRKFQDSDRNWIDFQVQKVREADGGVPKAGTKGGD